MKHLVNTNLQQSLSTDYRSLYSEEVKEKISAYAHGAPNATPEAELDYVQKKFEASVRELPKEITVLPAFDVNKYLQTGYTVLYASPKGTEHAAGTESDPLSLEAALEKARTCCQGGVAVLLQEGVYETSKAFELDEALSGTADAPFLFSSAEGAKVKITSAKTLIPEQFSPIPDSDPMKQRLPKEARDRVLCADLCALGWTEEERGTVVKHSAPIFYINDRVCPIARFPNESKNAYDLLFFTEADDSGSVKDKAGSRLYLPWTLRVKYFKEYKDFTEGKGDEPNWQISYSFMNREIMLYATKEDALADVALLQDELDRGHTLFTDSFGMLNMDHGFSLRLSTNNSPLANRPITEEDLAWIASWESIRDRRVMYDGNAYEGWDYDQFVLRSVVRKGDSYVLTTEGGSRWGCGASANSPTGHNTFFLYNAIEAMDTPGEWWLDEVTGKLYLYPVEDFANAKMEYCAVKDTLLHIHDAKNIIVNGISFEKSLDSAIFAEDSEDIVIQKCVVRETQDCGIHFRNDLHSAVLFNRFLRGKTWAVEVNNSDHWKAGIPSFNLVQNNLIDQPIGSNQHGIHVLGFRNAVSHNTLYLTQIRLDRAFDTVVEYNDLWGGHTDTSDSGLIYMSGYLVRGTHVRYNYLHDWNAPGNGVYLDDLNMGTYIYGNVIDTTKSTKLKPHGFVYTSTGHDHVIQNNFCVGRTFISETLTRADGAKSSKTLVGNIQFSIGEETADGLYQLTATIQDTSYTILAEKTDDPTKITYWGKNEAMEIWAVKSASDTEGDVVTVNLFHEDGSMTRYVNFDDRIKQSWLYFSDGCWLGYRFSTMSDSFYKTCAPFVTDASAYAARLPEMVHYLQLIGEHIDARGKEGYRTGPLEIYLRSLAVNRVEDNIVLGVPDAYAEGRPAAKAEGVDCNGAPKTYYGEHTDVEQNNLDIQSPAYTELLPMIEAYQAGGTLEDFRALMEKAEAAQKKQNPDYVSLSFVLDKVGVTNA